MDDPHDILLVDPDADGLAEHPVFGSGLGQNGSTSNLGASTPPCCATVRVSQACVMPRARSTARKVPPMRGVRFRFIPASRNV